MVFRPDFVLKELDRPYFRMVVEVKSELRERTDIELQVKNYMLATGCSVGMIVAPDETLIYRNMFIADTLDSIQLVADVGTRALLRLTRAPETGRDLERAVQLWLEDLSNGSASALPEDPDLRDLVTEIILPAAEATGLQAVGPAILR